MAESAERASKAEEAAKELETQLATVLAQFEELQTQTERLRSDNAALQSAIAAGPALTPQAQEKVRTLHQMERGEDGTKEDFCLSVGDC